MTCTSVLGVDQYELYLTLHCHNQNDSRITVCFSNGLYLTLHRVYLLSIKGRCLGCDEIAQSGPEHITI